MRKITAWSLEESNQFAGPWTLSVLSRDEMMRYVFRAMLLFMIVGCNHSELELSPQDEPRSDAASSTRNAATQTEVRSSKPRPTAESEKLRTEIGAPNGWSVRIVRQRTFTEDERLIESVILEMKTNIEPSPFRLAIADAQDGGSLNVRIKNICSEGFTTYCERSYKQPPTKKEIDQFAIDHNF